MNRFRYIFLLLLCIKLNAQKPDMVFNHITERDGLSFNIVNCFMKDQQGFLWIGTYNGLNRYDGKHFDVFKKSRNKNTLPDNVVHDLAEDQKGNIWGGTDYGIFCYDKNAHSFKTYQTPFVKNWHGVVGIICDQQGNIWASNVYCLLKYNAQLDRFERAPIKIGDPIFQNDYNIRKNGMVESPDGKGLWLATNFGLCYYDKTIAKMYSSFNCKDSILFTKHSSSALCATKFGHFWSYDNVSRHIVGFDPILQKVNFIIKPKKTNVDHSIATLFEDNQHKLWCSTWEYNIFTIDYLDNNFQTEINYEKNSSTSIAGDFFWDMMLESDGNHWIGTVGGISIYNPKNAFYRIHQIAERYFTEINPSIVYITQNTKDSTWWIATNKGILLQYNPATLKCNEFDLNRMPSNKHQLKPWQIQKILFIQQKVILFSRNGAWIKEGNHSFEPFVLPGTNDTLLMKDAAILYDSLFYCSNWERIWCWNMKTNTSTEIKFNKQINTRDEGEPYIAHLTTTKNKIWTLNANGWLSYVKGNELMPIPFSNLAEEGKNAYYSKMEVDSKGNLWIAKKGTGLLYYNTNTLTYKMYREYNGIVSDNIMTVNIDQNDKIWSCAYNKFSVLNPLVNSFYNFKLPINENNYGYVNASTTLNNGNIIISIADKMVEFMPEKLSNPSVQNRPLISSIVVSGHLQYLNSKNAISLLPKQNSLLIKFGLLINSGTLPYDMLYILEGAEGNWTKSGSNFEASYNNLSSGTYRFKVKAVAKDKSWQTPETILTILIATPFYKSWWFVSILIILFVGILNLIYKYRMKQHAQLLQLENKAQLLEKEKAIVMYAGLKQQLNPHFLFNSLTSLNGLISIDPKKANQFLDKLSKIYRYILRNRDSETVKLKDELHFTQDYIDLQKTRFGNGFEVKVDIAEHYLNFRIIPVTLQNLIENALKHNTTDEEMPLTISIYVVDDYLHIDNNLQRKRFVETSNKQGLKSIQNLYSYIINSPLEILETESKFQVRVPLIS